MAMTSKRGKWASSIILIAAAALFLLAGLALHQAQDIALALSSGDYDLTWWTVDGGGATFSQGGDYSLGGTIGQPDAGAMSGGDYTLSGGFWGGIVTIVEEFYHLYLPLILKNYGP
jgi:hypothetical protein